MREGDDVTDTPANHSQNTCANCKFVGTYKRPRIMDATGFDDQLMFEGPGDGADGTGDETVYMCKAPTSVNGLMSPHPNTERIEPITCEVWRPQSAANTEAQARLAEIDRKIAEREARMTKKESNDE